MTDRRSLIAENAAQSIRIGELEAENARLREAENRPELGREALVALNNLAERMTVSKGQKELAEDILAEINTIARCIKSFSPK